MHSENANIARAIKCAETVLSPELAIALECAFEGEAEPNAAQYMQSAIDRFNVCAEKGIPLGGDDYEVLTFESEGRTTVGLLCCETTSREVTLCADKTVGRQFEERIAKATLEIDTAPLAPIVLGVGVADDPETAKRLARTALFRSADVHAPDKADAATERRILARINHNGSGAGGLGGRHTALAVAIERDVADPDGEKFVALSPGPWNLRRAAAGQKV